MGIQDLLVNPWTLIFGTTLAVTVLSSGIAWIVRVNRRFSQIGDINDLKRRVYGTERELEKHIAVADERDKTAKEEITRLRDRINGNH